MGTLTLSGSLTAGPSAAVDNQFPSGVTSVPFGLNPGNKPYNVDTGRNVANVLSPSAYAALGGIGTLGPVTQAVTLYLRTTTPLTIRLTTAVPSSADLLSVLPLNGILILEFPSDHYLKLVEVQGSGTVEYYVSGNQ